MDEDLCILDEIKLIVDCIVAQKPMYGDNYADVLKLEAKQELAKAILAIYENFNYYKPKEGIENG